MQPHRGTLILVLAIVGLVTGLGWILGPIAWVMGGKDLKEMDAGRMDPEGRGMTQAGKLIGMIVTILTIVSLLIACILIVFVFGGMALFVGAANQDMQQQIDNMPGMKMPDMKNGFPKIELILPFWQRIAG